jgi:hypothetical protein
LLVGRGTNSGPLRVFAVAPYPALVALLPASPEGPSDDIVRLAIGNFVAENPGREVAVAQADAARPVRVFGLDDAGPFLLATIDLNAPGTNVAAIVAAP